MNYSINKGIGKSVEFKGLSSQYIFILAGGLLGLFLLFVTLAIAGVPNIVSLTMVIACAALLIWWVFAMSKQYGAHGVMKRQARSYRPRYIINRKSPSKLFKRDAKHI